MLEPTTGAVSPSEKRKALWRDAGDAVQLLRLTGGRLNEVLRMKLDQINWGAGSIKLFGGRPRIERDVPLSEGVERIIRMRIREGLTRTDSLSSDSAPHGANFIFPRAKTATFDNAIARACRKAAEIAKLNYGQANGFTCHSLRHTFITDLMEKTGNDAGTVMKYSGHKTLESFSTYLHPTDQGRILAIQALNSVGLFLGGLEGQEGHQGQEGLQTKAVKPLQIKEVAV